MNKKTVLLRAPLLSQSGYGVHSRQVARWLFDRADALGNLEIHTELLNWGATPWYTDQYALDGLIGRCFQASADRKDMYDVTIQLQLPNEWYPAKGKFNIGMTAGVESTMGVVVLPELIKVALVNSEGTITRFILLMASTQDG